MNKLFIRRQRGNESRQRGKVHFASSPSTVERMASTKGQVLSLSSPPSSPGPPLSLSLSCPSLPLLSLSPSPVPLLSLSCPSPVPLSLLYPSLRARIPANSPASTAVILLLGDHLPRRCGVGAEAAAEYVRARARPRDALSPCACTELTGARRGGRRTGIEEIQVDPPKVRRAAALERCRRP